MTCHRALAFAALLLAVPACSSDSPADTAPPAAATPVAGGAPAPGVTPAGGVAPTAGVAPAPGAAPTAGVAPEAGSHAHSALEEAMEHVDFAFERLGAVRSAGWVAPTDQPGLVPATEAGQLAAQFRLAGKSEEARDYGAGMGEKMNAAALQADALQQGLLKGKAHAELDAMHEALKASCTDCHDEFRDADH